MSVTWEQVQDARKGADHALFDLHVLRKPVDPANAGTITWQVDSIVRLLEVCPATEHEFALLQMVRGLPEEEQKVIAALVKCWRALVAQADADPNRLQLRVAAYVDGHKSSRTYCGFSWMADMMDEETTGDTPGGAILALAEKVEVPDGAE